MKVTAGQITSSEMFLWVEDIWECLL